jgi:hypothetical protein
MTTALSLAQLVQMKLRARVGVWSVRPPPGISVNAGQPVVGDAVLVA